MNLLILLIFILVVVFSAIIGFKRGIIWTGIRVGLLFVAVLVAIALSGFMAEGLILNILEDNVSATVPAAFESVLSDSSNYELTSIMTIPLSGIALSLVKPIAFAILFVIGIILSLLIYLLAKLIIKSVIGAKILREIPLAHKITGAVVGALVSIYAFAMVISPIYVPVQILDETGRAQQIFRIARHVIEMNDEKRASSDKSNISETINTVENVYNMILRTPIGVFTKVTLANSFSKGLYEKLATIERADLTSDNSSPEEFNIVSIINEFMPLVQDTDEFLNILDDDNAAAIIVVDAAENLFTKTANVKTVLSENEKLAIVNLATDKINNELSDFYNNGLYVDGYYLDGDSLDELIGHLEHYNSFEEFKTDISNYFEFIRTIIEFGLLE